jgi:hypothetical protein
LGPMHGMWVSKSLCLFLTAQPFEWLFITECQPMNTAACCGESVSAAVVAKPSYQRSTSSFMNIVAGVMRCNLFNCSTGHPKAYFNIRC